MFGKKNVDALVVGAGPIGMVAALELAQRNVDTMIVDAASRCCTQSNALLLHPDTLLVLERIGVLDRVLEAGYKIDRINLFDVTEIRDTVRLSELPTEYPYAIGIPQSTLEFILEEELARCGVSVLWKHRASDITIHETGIVADIDRYSDQGMGYSISRLESVIDKTLHINCRYLFSTDGYNSLIRNISRQEMASLGPAQYFAFFEFETDHDSKHAVNISFKNNLATAQYPLVDGQSRFSFQYTGLSIPSEYRNKERRLFHENKKPQNLLNDSYLKELIDLRVPWNSGYVNRITYRALAPFEKRYLKQPFQNRLLFLGDAARSFPPIGATSMNLGIQEAEETAVAVKESLDYPNSQRNIDELGRYFALKWEAIANLERNCLPIEKADPWIAGNRARILRCLPATGESLENLASQLLIRLSLSNLAKA